MQDREEIIPEGKAKIKDRECAKCKFLFDCEGKLRHIKRCLYYKERKNNGN